MVLFFVDAIQGGNLHVLAKALQHNFALSSHLLFHPINYLLPEIKTKRGGSKSVQTFLLSSL